MVEITAVYEGHLHCSATHGPSRTRRVTSAAAASTLARAGTPVLLVDKARFPRDKCCGDGLTADALRQLEGLGLRPDAVPDWQPVHEVFVRSPVGRTVSFPLPDDG